MAFHSPNLLSKMASGKEDGENSAYFDGWKAYDANPYHPVMNPNGVIQMGLAENQLSLDLVEEWIKANQKASICSSKGSMEFREIANFQDYHGLPSFRRSVASFMGRVRGDGVKFEEERIVMSGGATGAHETIAFCLADPGEAFLVPTPYYPGFDRDLTWRTGVRLIPVPTHSFSHFQITMQALESAYGNALSHGIRVKGLIITNPSNPLGTVMNRDTLIMILNFISQKRIHLVCDEIYSATTFNKPRFVSVAEIINEGALNCDKNFVHIIYSLSKDMGLPGFRVGIIYSYNDEIVNVARKMSSFGLVSSQTQYLLASMLSDDEFVTRFIKQNKKRLARRHRMIAEGLEQVGIQCLGSGSAGLFLWADLRKLLKEPTYEAEMRLWRVIVSEAKLNVSPGSSFHCDEPGWFRVCFANMDDSTAEVALTRIRKLVAQNVGRNKHSKKLCWQSSLELGSSSSRIFDDFLVSPHSPIPLSPLVRST